MCISTSGKPSSCYGPDQIQPDEVELGNGLVIDGHRVYTREKRGRLHDDQQHGNIIQELMTSMTHMVKRVLRVYL